MLTEPSYQPDVCLHKHKNETQSMVGTGVVVKSTKRIDKFLLAKKKREQERAREIMMMKDEGGIRL